MISITDQNILRRLSLSVSGPVHQPAWRLFPVNHQHVSSVAINNV